MIARIIGNSIVGALGVAIYLLVGLAFNNPYADQLREREALEQLKEIRHERCIKFVGNVANKMDGRIYLKQMAVQAYEACLENTER